MPYHANDRLAALSWAVAQAEKPNDDPLASLNLAVLREMLAEAQQEARK